MTETPTMESFPVRPQPKAGESLYGYLWRFYVDSNGNRIPSVVVSAVDAIRRGAESTDELLWAGQGTCRPAVELLSARERALYQEMRQRSRFKWTRLPRRSRYCPACIADGQTHQLIVDMPMVSACPRHGVRLLEACTNCKAPLCWSRMRPGWRCPCNLPVAGMPVAIAPVWEQRISRGVEHAFLGGQLNDLYEALQFMCELRRQLHAEPHINATRAVPKGDIQAPGRWEAQLLTQSVDVIADRIRRMIKRSFRHDAGPLIAIGQFDAVAETFRFFSALPVRVRDRMSTICEAVERISVQSMHNDGQTLVLFHPRLSTADRHRADADLCSWWGIAWPPCDGVRDQHGLLRAVDWSSAMDGALITSFLNDVLRFARSGKQPLVESALVTRWRPPRFLAGGFISIAGVVEQLGRLNSTEIQYIAALAEQDANERQGQRC